MSKSPDPAPYNIYLFPNEAGTLNGKAKTAKLLKQLTTAEVPQFSTMEDSYPAVYRWGGKCIKGDKITRSLQVI